jgi:hypothetical protein
MVGTDIARKNSFFNQLQLYLLIVFKRKGLQLYIMLVIAIKYLV